MAYLIHYNKNHNPKNGQFAPGDGNGDGIVGTKKKGQYSAKIENYHKGNMFRNPYYIDKRGNKRSYMSYKEMPVDAQAAEIARANGKKTVKKVAGTVAAIATPLLVTAGAAFVISKVAGGKSNAFSKEELKRMGINIIEPDFIHPDRIDL